MTRDFLQFDGPVVCRATGAEFSAAGWEMHVEEIEGFPGGPVIYLCDYEAQSVLCMQLVIGGVEIAQRWAAGRGVTHQDAVEDLGQVMDQPRSGERTLTAQTRHGLTLLATLYLAGTRTYALNARAEHFLILRHVDADAGERILRPAAAPSAGLMTPQEVSQVVLATLHIDRQQHPKRFRGYRPFAFAPGAKER